MTFDGAFCTQNCATLCVDILAATAVVVLGNDHLVFSTIQVAPGRQWDSPVAGWRFLLIRCGRGVYATGPKFYPVGQGDALVLTSTSGGLLQAHPTTELTACLFPLMNSPSATMIRKPEGTTADPWCPPTSDAHSATLGPIAKWLIATYRAR